jgi:hypothetical protein
LVEGQPPIEGFLDTGKHLFLQAVQKETWFPFMVAWKLCLVRTTLAVEKFGVEKSQPPEIMRPVSPST